MLADVLFIFLLVIFLPNYFLALELLIGLIPYKKKQYTATTASCAIIIPAHDEEITLQATLTSIKEQVTENDRVIVVADNCTDATASIAKQMGMEVLERFDAENRGKGYALAYAIRHVSNFPVDIVVFVDADCQMEPNSLAILKSACVTHNTSIQGRYQFYAPQAAPATRKISEFALYIKNHVRMLGLYRLGGSVPITGSGFAIPFTMLQHFDLNTGDIVEDMKLGVDIALSGKRVMYIPEAEILTPLPLSNEDADKQRTRWEHGHIATILRYCPSLLQSAISNFSKTRLLTAFDLAIPPLFILSVISVVISGAGLIFAYILADIRLLYASLAPQVLIAVGLFAANWQAKTLRFRQFLDIFTFAFGKMDIYRKILKGHKSGWEKTKRDRPPK